MKIRITVTVDIDPESYMHEYGVAQSEIREDVKYHAESVLRETFAHVRPTN